MRIAGGQNKGRRLKVSKKGIRPTKGIVREAIFNIVGSRIQGAEGLDIFAGSGALGLEAISRGAKNCVFIEKKPRTLLQNIKNLFSVKKTKVIKNDFRIGLRKVKKQKFDIIFLDPPYNKNYIEKTISIISKYGLLKDEGIIIAEHYVSEKFGLPDDLCIVKEKRYGETTVTLIGLM